ncbi:hypothetical protein E4T50_10048 [Aureobasidium sp. EXF-12298]|nr:hypothetical protein E4T50_10048 [Aureobasidium sp. EXF-12298]
MTQTSECGICRDVCKKIFTAECGHSYCLPCLGQHVKQAIKQESTFPVSCCSQEISYDQVKTKLPPHIRLQFAAAQEEYSTPTAHRVTDAPVKECATCGASTCVSCKEVKHEGACEAEDLTSVLDLAKTQNWQNCGGCNAIVEMSFGCNHITFVDSPSHLVCPDANLHVVVDVVSSFVIYVVPSGRHATVNNGQSKTCSRFWQFRTATSPLPRRGLVAIVMTGSLSAVAHAVTTAAAVVTS